MTCVSFIQKGTFADVQSMSDFDDVDCVSCGSVECELYYDSKYHGMRASCNSCQINWPES
ncbi:MAG TPA: hypothetical protein VLD64_08090 [Nitrosarchaeum sp.]|nr:hypothetical protein [Nitrosarchaeum sp.]